MEEVSYMHGTTIVIPGIVNANGGDGGDGHNGNNGAYRPGAGGAGGSIIFKCQTFDATGGTITALGGNEAVVQI